MSREPVSERMVAVVTEALDAEQRLGDPMRGVTPTPANDIRRAKILHATHATISAWVDGRLTEAQAIDQIRVAVLAARDD